MTWLRWERLSPVRVLVAALLVLGGSVVLIAPVATPPAQAALPVECGTADVACARMYIANDRSGDFGLAPLPGTTFGLFLSDPSATIDANNGFAQPDAAHPVYFTCVSQSDGDCVFVIPIAEGAAAVGASQSAPWANTGAGHVPQGTRMYAAALAAPSGYYANPWWQTGPLSGSASEYVSLRHIFTTPQLVGGQVYERGVDWVKDPGLQTVPATVVPGNNYPRRVASAGRTPLSRFNNDMVEQCGLDVALVVDVSSSVGTSLASRQQLVGAMNTFVDALHGTPSRVALHSFGTDSPANGFDPNTSLRSVATTSEANAFKRLYDDNSASNPTNNDWDRSAFSWPTNYTNWDRGFAAVASANEAATPADRYDLVVFLTDGNPTVYGPAPLAGSGQLKDPNSGYTRFREVGDGLASANLVKSQGSRILALGVGAGVAGEGAEVNLRTISGRDAYDGNNILDADYFQTANYGAAAEALHDIILASCAPSISIVKRILPDGSTDPDDAILPTQPWSLTVNAAATGSTDDVTITPAGGTGSANTATAATEAETGSKSFDLEFDAADEPVDLDFTETGQAGYTPVPGLTQCVNKTADDAPVAVTTTTTGTPGADMSVALDSGIDVDAAVSCVIYNQAPPDLTPASVIVHKQWELHTADGVAVLPDGRQPSGLTAQLELTGPTAAGFTPQAWSDERSGYAIGPAATANQNSVRIDETVAVAPDLPGCTLGDSTIAPGQFGPPGTDPVDPGVTHALSAGVNEWTITNEVTCVSTLTLAKDAIGGPLDNLAGEQLWTLHAQAEQGTGVPALDGFEGATGTPAVTDIAVRPGSTYVLSETRPVDPPVDSDAHYTYHYLQDDARTRPLYYPDSSGSWSCRNGGSAPGDTPEVSIGPEGAVVVPLGAAYVCTAYNRTAAMSVAKTVNGGTALPSDFTFRASWLPPLTVPGSQATAHDFPSGEEQSLVPGQHYALSELTSANYTLASLICTTAGQDLDPADFALLPGAIAECAATNQYGNWTAAKASNPPSRTQVQPGATITYTITAYQLVAAGVTNDAQVVDDLSDVLSHATLVPGSITASTGTTDLSGARLTWDIPTLTTSENPTLTYQVRIDSDAWNISIGNHITRNTGIDCADITPADGYLVDSFSPDCNETTHPTPPRDPDDPDDPTDPDDPDDPDNPNDPDGPESHTGAAVVDDGGFGLLYGAGAAFLIGLGGLTALVRRRRRT